MNAEKPDIGIIYSESAFDVEELGALENKIAACGLKLMSQERSPFVNASIDFFIPFIEILLSPNMVSALLQGTLVNAVYDAIKQLLISIFYKFSKRPVLKIQSDQIKEVPANIHFVIGNNRLVLPVTADDEKFRYVVDKFLDIAAASMPTETTYAFYSKADNAILIKTEEEIIQDECEKRKRQKAQDL